MECLTDHSNHKGMSNTVSLGMLKDSNAVDAAELEAAILDDLLVGGEDMAESSADKDEEGSVK